MKKTNGFFFLLFVASLILFAFISFALAQTFIAQETDLIQIKPEARDPDQDDVTFSYQPPFDKEGKWQTDFTDAGLYQTIVTASDGVNEVRKEITIVVENKKRIPSIIRPPISIKEGELLQLKLPSTDLDGLPLNYTFTKPLNERGEWLTNYHDSGEYLFQVEVSNGETNSTKIIVNIEDVNLLPIINLPEELTVNEGETLEWNLTVYDPDDDEIEVSLLNAPENSTYDQKQKFFTWKPSFKTIQREPNWFSNLLNLLRVENYFLKQKEFPLEIEICTTEDCFQKTVSLLVQNTNQKPIFAPFNTTLQINAQEKTKFVANVTDPDGDFVDVTFSWPIKKEGSWEPQLSDLGEQTVYVTASDGWLEEQLALKINVLPPNLKPVIKVDKKTIVAREGDLIEFKVKATDPDDKNIQISAENLPRGASFKENEFAWQIPRDLIETKSSSELTSDLVSLSSLDNLFSKDYIQNIKIIASDGKHQISEIIKIIVEETNIPPKVIDFLPEAELTVYAHQPVLFHVVAKDEEWNPVSYEWSFNFYEPKIKGTDTIKRTFVKPGKKKVTVKISDQENIVTKEWIVNVLAAEKKIPSNYKVYIIEN